MESDHGHRAFVTKAAAWMSGWLAAMVVMVVAGREATRSLHVFQIMEMRSLLGLVLLYPLVRASGGLAAMRTARAGLHIARNTFHYAAQFGWFLALTMIPIAAGRGDRVHDADLDRDPGRVAARRALERAADRSPSSSGWSAWRRSSGPTPAISIPAS